MSYQEDNAKNNYEAFNAVTLKTDEEGHKYHLIKEPIRLKGLHIITDGGYTAPVSPSLIFKKIKNVTHTYGLDPIFLDVLPIERYRIEISKFNEQSNFLRINLIAVRPPDNDILFEITLTDLVCVIVEHYHPKELEILIDSYINHLKHDTQT